MPQNITDVSTFTDPIVEMADADALDPTYVRTALQGLANRTRWLKDNFTKKIDLGIGFIDLLDVGVAGAWVSNSANARWTSGATIDVFYLPLVAMPNGVTISGIAVKVHPSTAHTTLSDRMIVSLVKVDVDGVRTNAGTVSGTTDHDDGTGNVQTINVAFSAAPVIDRGTYSYRLEIRSSVAVSGDELRSVFVSFTP